MEVTYTIQLLAFDFACCHISLQIMDMCVKSHAKEKNVLVVEGRSTFLYLWCRSELFFWRNQRSHTSFVLNLVPFSNNTIFKKNS